MFYNNPYSYPYSSKRISLYANKGMVLTSQALAAEAGLEILKKGGNAIDAAIATASTLTVVEPTSNGIGGDAFCLVWTNNKLYGLNGSGYAPKSLSIKALKDRGVEEIPRFGFIPVTVPGAVSTWQTLHQRFGKLKFSEVLQPAINYARYGYPLTPTLAYNWQRAFNIYKKHLKGEEYSSWFETFAPNDKAPEVGEIWKSEAHAKTLELIANSYGRDFYEGEIADKIDAFSKKYNGFIRKSDLENYHAEWVEPISVNYKGFDVWEIPPNGQGLIALMALNILKNDEFTHRDDVETFHKQIEAMKIAFSNGLKYITQYDKIPYRVEELLSDEFAKAGRKLISDKAGLPEPFIPPKGGTVYLACADQYGNMVSFIQSNYMGFGSGLVVPGTGIALQNRGHNFSLDKNHYNKLEPGKKTYHTIIPGFLTKDNEAIGPFGVMGAFMQPQGHLQVIMNTIDFKLNPQAALDAPRWQWVKDRIILVEQEMSNDIILGLANKGHEIRVEYDPSSFGRGQIIWRNPETGVLVGGTEKRTDSSIAVW